ncbi:hypothetical protein PR048_020696 [Dryococelus australis]|uniref:Uncharacterized protein n=1 Tax=Dryococelus australis TaxID=614101 RepID=A0ABQ9H7G2_9NEOP|nr:hypothetical protein PR048_020696 [Dryococelus australis]
MNVHSTGRITWWALKILEYNYDIKYTSGENTALELPVFLLPSSTLEKAQWGYPSLAPLIQETEKPSTVKTKFTRLAKIFVCKKINTRPKGWEKLLVIPMNLKVKILSECHNNRLVGENLELVLTVKPRKGRITSQQVRCSPSFKTYWVLIIRPPDATSNENNRKQQERAKQRYHLQRRVVEYQAGQEVLAYTTTRNKGMISKLKHH